MRFPSYRFLFSILLFVSVSACTVHTTSQAIPYIDINNLEPLPTPANPDVLPLRIAISAVVSPQGTAESYSLLLDYLSIQLGRPVERVQRRTYAEINDLIREGEVDLAFVCTSSYLIGNREFGMELLAAPQVNDEIHYHAQLIVPIDSSARSIEDLRDAVFAFTDPTSFTGRIYPTYLLQQMGEAPDRYFRQTFFTYSHDDAIYAVANGVADGASVDNLVLEFALKRDPDLSKKIRVIYTSPPFGMPPVVVGPSIRPQLQAQLIDILLQMHRTPEGQAALQALDYDRFVLVSEENYQAAQVVEAAVQCCSSDEP